MACILILYKIGQYLVKYESDLIAAHAAQKLNELELPSGEKIYAEYFNEKSELLNSLNKTKSVEDMLRNLMGLNSNSSQQIEMDEQNEDNLVLDNIKAFLNQQTQFKQHGHSSKPSKSSSSSNVYMNSVLNQVKVMLILNNQIVSLKVNLRNTPSFRSM